jgi:hypothetical protein
MLDVHLSLKKCHATAEREKVDHVTDDSLTDSDLKLKIMQQLEHIMFAYSHVNAHTNALST